MQGFISISKNFALIIALLALASIAPLSNLAAAADAPETPGPSTPAKDKTMQPEDEDFSGTAFTDYGEFNEAAEEEENTKFLQHGRFFGVSLGLGFETVTGNRGLLWQGGFPTIDFKVAYWFDFNFALDLGMYSASQFFSASSSNGGNVSVNMLYVGVDLKYYFDTRNLSAPISFANPYIMVGSGAYTKTQNSASQQTTASDSEVGFSAGAGLEFAIKPRKSYFQIEGRMHVVTFQDTYSTAFQPQIPDLTGLFFTLTGNFLFTW